MNNRRRRAVPFTCSPFILRLVEVLIVLCNPSHSMFLLRVNKQDLMAQQTQYQHQRGGCTKVKALGNENRRLALLNFSDNNNCHLPLQKNCGKLLTLSSPRRIKCSFNIQKATHLAGSWLLVLFSGKGSSSCISSKVYKAIPCVLACPFIHSCLRLLSEQGRHIALRLFCARLFIQ